MADLMVSSRVELKEYKLVVSLVYLMVENLAGMWADMMA